MYRLFYRHPNRYIQDCLFSVLQIIVLTAPDLFMKELITFHPDLIIRLLTDLLMEESSYINFSKACKF